MKKIYAYILLTVITTLSTSCMELEHKKTDVLNIQSSSSIVRPAGSKLYSINTLNGLLQPNSLPTPVIQRKYTDLDITPVYVPINTNESSNTDDIELTPIYRPIEGSTTEYFDCITNTKKSIPQEEQKPNVYTNNFAQVNKEDLINELHNAASMYKVYYDKDDPFLEKHQQLTHIITLMRQAKKNNIHEDFMITYAYKKSCRYAYYKAFTPLLFGCLKKYMATTKQTYETIPFDGLFLDANTVKALGLSCQPVTKEDIDKIPQTYPAYTALIDTVTKQPIHSGFDELIDCLYLNPGDLLDGYQQYNVTNFDNFYFCAHQLLYRPRNDTVYNIISLFEWMRNKEKISCKDMCQKILNCNPTETFTTWWHYGNMSCANTPYGKNKIVMLYTLVEEYNNTRKNRKTPTGKQYAAYNQKKAVDIALPDNFDATLFDKKMYAFTAFRKLKHGIEILTNSSSHDLETMVELKMKQLTTKANSST